MKDAQAYRVVIVGGGISGLAAAHRLLERKSELRRPLELLLIEAGPKLGGIVRTIEREGFLLEAGPDSFISEKPEALELATRIDLGKRLIETNREHRRSFIVRAGRLCPVPEGFQLLAPSRLWPFVTSEIFSWTGKARMALDLILPRRSSTNGSVDESLAQFVRRRLGREALERMAQPMVGGIYTADPEHLSLRATMPRFLEMERAHRSLILAMLKERRRRREKEAASGPRYGLFLSFDRGMQVFTDRLAELLPASCLRLSTRVESLSLHRQDGLWSLQTGPQESILADGVCLAVPSFAAASLVRRTDAQLAAELESIAYASTATVNLAYKRSDIPHALDGFGFVVPFIERRSTLACTFSSVKFRGRAPEGCALLRAFVGGALQPEKFALDEDEMVRAVRADLRDLLGIERPPLFAHAEKWPRSMAQYHLGHTDKVQAIQSRLNAYPTLQLAGNAYTGAGIPDCIRSGQSAADQLMESMNK